MLRRLPLLLALAAALAAAGCSSAVDRRIHARQAQFNQLDPVSQANIRNGQVDLGFTPDMVFMALGEPTRREQKLVADGVQMTWVYKAYYNEMVGTADVAYRRQIVYNPRSRTYAIFVEPAPGEVYAVHAQDRVKVQFTNGKVSSIEQDKDA